MEKKLSEETKPRAASAKATRTRKKSVSALEKMQLLITVVNRDKSELYIDLLQAFEVNMQMVLSASGTAPTSTLNLLGLAESEKAVIISVIRRDRAKEALALLEEKFRTVRGGKGIAYTVPMSSVIGVAIYQFLSNKS
ncbi:MAG: hypothetical protein IKA64_07560 [Clostridia bacterium]|nr:hypothetical protein [Clostridia bacterium]